MYFNSQSIARIEHLRPYLRFIGDMAEVIIHDDAKDIMVFSTANHPSPFHHNQWGIFMKMAAELGIAFVDIGKKLMEQEDRSNIELKKILAILEEVKAEKQERAFTERILRERRVILMKQAWEAAKMEPQLAPIYGGNISEIRVNRPRPLPQHIEPPRVPKPKLQL